MRRMLAALLMAAAAPTRAAIFDDFLPGAKAMGMGMAYSAIADDHYAMFFNPSGTANAPYQELGGGVGRQQSPIGSMTYGTLMYVRPYEPINTATIGAAYLSER